jgi:NADH-quinone oxidoreductase subunit G
MIQEAGIDFAGLEPEPMDMPMGMATGAGVLFGKSGGVSEAVLRYAAEKLGAKETDPVDLTDVRGLDGLREAEVKLGDTTLRLAVVHGLKNAARIAEKVLSGEAQYDVVEVMACPGGCIGGAGQPIAHSPRQRMARAKAIAHADQSMPLRKAQDNPYIQSLYGTVLDEPNGHTAHHMLHTAYTSRRRISDEEISLSSTGADRVKVRVCVGTSCYLRGAHGILSNLLKTVEDNDWQQHFDIGATFCTESCDQGPTVVIDDTVIHHADDQQVAAAVKTALASRKKA